MPSSRNPRTAVAAGAGKLPAGVVPAGSLLFTPGAGTEVALQQHIINPLDAHMSGAIGIPPTYAVTGEALLSLVGGPIDGESVLDFIAQAKDLLPIRPNVIGAAGVGIPNTGVPNWGNINTPRTGGWKKGGASVFSHYLMATGIANFITSGLVYPADRGVLAFYQNTDGNFFNAGATTLVAALWLGSSPAPAGIASANFNQAIRTVNQVPYVASAVGLDLFSLTNRLPYLKDYSGYGGVYSVYDTNFYAYQLATYGLPAQAVAAGDAGSFLLVHWRESFAVSLAAIGPANLTVGNLVTSKAYSSVPVASDFDTGNAANTNRHNVFRDSASAASPSGNTFTTVQVGVPTQFPLSGVGFYNQGATDLIFNVTLAANALFANSFQTSATPDGVNVPTGFASASYPITVDFTDFGGSTLALPYYALRKQGVPGVYSPVNPPATADVGEYINATLAIVAPTSASPSGGAGILRTSLRSPFQGPVSYNDSTLYLYNSYPQNTSTATNEPFVDEQYRYISSYAAGVAAAPTIPAGGNIYNSAAVIAIAGADLQVIGHRAVYPQTNLTAYVPAGPNYAAVAAGDAVNHPRRFIRAFNTGIARNTGKLRLRFTVGSEASFTTDSAYTGVETVGHVTGGMIIQVKVPGGATGWLDLGRDLGDPGLGVLDYYGCSTGVLVSGSDVTVSFQTTAFTSDNGSAEFPLFIRISMLNNIAGLSISLDNVEWLAP